MPLTLDIQRNNAKSYDYSESYFIDFNDTDRLEKILESVDGRFEIDGTTIRRHMPEGGVKAKVPLFLIRRWGHFYEDHYEDTAGTQGILYEEGRLVAPDSNFFDRVTRRASPENQAHLMLPGHPAQNWCLEVEWESEASQSDKGFAKVNRLFSFTGAEGTNIEEIWLLIYPQLVDKILSILEA
jgi:hypothetical protein